MSIELSACPRCGADHGRVFFNAFTNPREGGYTYFFMCPKVVEPVLIRWRSSDAPSAPDFEWDAPS